MPPTGDARQRPDRHDTNDHRLAAALATETGTLLVDLRRRRRLDTGEDLHHPDALRAAGDRLAHELLAAALGEARPHDAVLSEEAPDDGRRLAYRRVWIIDPLDGTRQYGEPGRTDWAVHVALVIDGMPVAGAVALPAEGVTLSTAEPPVLPPPASEGAGTRLRVIGSRSRPNRHAAAVAAALGAELDALGSVGAKVAAVIEGRADAYVHSGGQYEWDSAAPVAVAVACGLHASRLDGRPLRYNRADPELPNLLICRPEIAEAAVAAAAAVGIPA